VPAGDKHWCPGCKQPIHAVCGVLDEQQDSIAYMSWCYDCHEGRKMPAQQLAPIKQKRQRSSTRRKKSPSHNSIAAEAPDKKQPNSKKPTKSKNNNSKFKIVVCAWEMRSNVTKNVAFCSEHGIRMCTVLRPLPPQSPLAKALLDKEKKKCSMNGTAMTNR
jgi:hypothetical protein